jgi:amino-acid N-acetyltransferase
MKYNEPPYFSFSMGESPLSKINNLKNKSKEIQNIFIQKAQIHDVEGILELINGYAALNLMLPRGPQYLYENIRDFVIAVDRNGPDGTTVENREITHLIAACGSLHVLWEDIAEIRALSTHPDYKNNGIGSKLVEYMKLEAKQLGIRRLFTFTLNEVFFKSHGFQRQKKEELPAKVWGECSRCPKYFKCDEIGMMMDL